MTGFLRQFFLLTGTVLFSLTPALASDSARSLQDGVSLVREWTPDQHLYLKGKTGLPEQLLNDLEKWLDKNAQNWTILITEHTRGEKYRDAFNQNFKGVDAVEHALTFGLQAKTGFGELRNSKTKLLDGALFIIYLEDRKFSYFGSDHYSRNGASPNRWSNGLDREAKKAMQNGRRIIDAVKNTVTSIDQKATTTISARERNRIRQAAKAKANLTRLKERLATVTEKHASIFSKISDGDGDITRFPAEQIKSQIKSMEATPGTFDTTLIERNLDRWENRLDQYQADAQALASFEQKLKSTSAESSDGEESLILAQSEFKAAQNSYQLGNFSYRQFLTNARNKLDQVATLDLSSKRASEKRTLAVKVGSATGIGGLALLGFAGNRRRHRIKAEAEKLLASRQLEMKKTEDRLFELMDRSSVIVGPFDELENRGYTGDTLALSRQSLKHIDKAFVLSSNVQKIIEEGEELINPRNPLSRSRNFISGGRYEAAVDLLDAELNVGLKTVPKLKERDRPGEEVDETFSLPIDAWEARTTTALDSAKDCLDRVETAWSTIIARSETLNKNINALTDRQPEAQTDEWLRCELLFEDWLPTITDFSERASDTGKSDPVRALDGDLSQADRMVHEAKSLLDRLKEFRANHWKEMETNEATLDKRHRATVWIDNSLASLSKDAETIANDSPDHEVSHLISSLNTDLESLAQRVTHGAALIERADEVELPAIKSANQIVNTARREIATALKLKPDEILVEENHNPSDFLNKASLQHEASLAALDLGEVASAEGFLNESKSLTAHATTLVKDTREILANYHETSEALWNRRGALEERGNQLISEVEAMRIRYAPRALFLDPEAPESGSFADAPTQLESALKGIVKRLDRAKTRFTAGGLLESWDLITQGQNLAQDGEELSADITTRFKALDRMENENAGTHESQTRAGADFREPVNDRRVTEETIKLFEIIGTKLAEAGNEIEAGDGRRDPYLVEDLLENLSERIPILRKAIAEDLEQNARALQLFDTVNRNQAEAGKLWETADGDRIPNSPKTNESMNQIEDCHGKLEDAHRNLRIDHADWREIQNDLRKIHLTLSESILSLKKELQLAREAVRALEASTREVRKASRWSGSYGVRITGNYGQRALAAANDVMQHGLYQEALQMAGQARSRARSAIANAEAREAAKRRAAQAARRRRQQASSRSSFSSSSSFGSSSRSSGSSSRSSGSSFGSSSRSGSSSVGRSSFSSGSGAGRSSW